MKGTPISEDTKAKIRESMAQNRLKPCFHCGHRARSTQPIEGLSGERECRDVAACEDRIVKAWAS